jgi:leucyl-tRNA synthetase
MFDQISRVYDPMNLIISAFQEPRWRRRAVAFAALKAGGRAIDVATGTGKVAADLLPAAAPDADVLAAAKVLPGVAKYLEGKTVVKEVVVPGRLVSLVVR